MKRSDPNHIGRGSVERIQFPNFAADGGMLTAVEAGTQVPFDIARVFMLSNLQRGHVRGEHANLDYQVLVLVAGQIRVTTHDGAAEENYMLDSVGSALVLQPPIWRTIEALIDGSVCVVLSSHTHSEDNYIRDFEQFRALAGTEH